MFTSKPVLWKVCFTSSRKIMRNFFLLFIIFDKSFLTGLLTAMLLFLYLFSFEVFCFWLWLLLFAALRSALWVKPTPPTIWCSHNELSLIKLFVETDGQICHIYRSTQHQIFADWASVSRVKLKTSYGNRLMT